MWPVFAVHDEFSSARGYNDEADLLVIDVVPNSFGDLGLLLFEAQNFFPELLFFGRGQFSSELSVESVGKHVRLVVDGPA